MGRKTSIQAEADHIHAMAGLIEKLRDNPKDRKLRLTLKSGLVIEGKVKRSPIQRHLVEIDREARARGSDLASGDVIIEEKGTVHILDLLNVERAEVATPDKDPSGS